MAFRSFKQRTPPPEVPTSPRLRCIAQQPQWSLAEYLCMAGPHDRPFEERHDAVSVALVTAGTFRYRTNTGEGLLYPGAFLLGNAGACYECGHEHSRGDQCLALRIERELFAEIACGSAGSSRCDFRAPMLPAVAALASTAVSLQQAAVHDSRLAVEEMVLGAVGTIVRAVATKRTPPRRPKPAAARRMAAAFEYIGARFSTDLSLGELSAAVAMSKYHFLRTFKQVSGMTPHQYILARRVRAAAAALRSTERPIACVALDQGFGDLSTFNHTFRRVMGVTPTAFRSNA
jgi:AraC family transcriptional regulator